MLVGLSMTLVACGQNMPRTSVASSVSKTVTLPSLSSFTKRSNKTKAETQTQESTIDPNDHGLAYAKTPVSAIQYQPTVLAKNNATNPYLPPYEDQPARTKSPVNAVTGNVNSNTINPTVGSTTNQVTPTKSLVAPVTPSTPSQTPVNHTTTTVEPAAPVNSKASPSQAKAIGAINQSDVPAMEASQSIFTPQKEMAAPSAGIVSTPMASPNQEVNTKATKPSENAKKNATTTNMTPAPATKGETPASVSATKETQTPANAVIQPKPQQPVKQQQQAIAPQGVGSANILNQSAVSPTSKAKPVATSPTVNAALPKEVPATVAKPETQAASAPMLKPNTVPNAAAVQKSVTLPVPQKPLPPAPGSLNQPSKQPSSQSSNQTLPAAPAPSGYNRPSYQRFNEQSNEPPPTPVQPKRPAPTSFDQVPVPVVN